MKHKITQYFVSFLHTLEQAMPAQQVSRIILKNWPSLLFLNPKLEEHDHQTPEKELKSFATRQRPEPDRLERLLLLITNTLDKLVVRYTLYKFASDVGVLEKLSLG